MNKPAHSYAPAQWIGVPYEKYEHGRTEGSSGLEFQVFVSPYDVPEAVRGRYDTKLGCFVIEFRYIGDEDWKEEKVHEHICLHLGKNSNRLKAIIADVKALGVNQVVLCINRAIDDYARKLPGMRAPATNFEIAQGIIADKKQKLFQSLAASA